MTVKELIEQLTKLVEDDKDSYVDNVLTMDSPINFTVMGSSYIDFDPCLDVAGGNAYERTIIFKL